MAPSHSAPALPFAHLNLRRNPFGETDLVDRLDFAVVDVAHHIERLRRPGAAVLFLGEKGHGKTTHLIAIQAAFPNSIYVHVGEGERPRFAESMPLFIDELQRVPERERRRLFRRNVSFALASHEDVTDELTRAGIEVQTVHVGGALTRGALATILERRIAWARRGAGPLPGVGRATIRKLLARHGADLRAIEQQLYDCFQQLEHIREV
ncbi:MAG: hypothetical protein KDA42_07355 [Planctomycetales bacterium]|nr:hypothetical protein [Planctomycetales bacterium]